MRKLELILGGLMILLMIGSIVVVGAFEKWDDYSNNSWYIGSEKARPSIIMNSQGYVEYGYGCGSTDGIPMTPTNNN